MYNNNNLDKYFSEAKNQPNLLNNDEIQNIITPPLIPAPSFWQNKVKSIKNLGVKKMLAVSSSLAVLSTFGIMTFNSFNPNNDNLISQNTEPSPVKIELQSKTAQNDEQNNVHVYQISVENDEQVEKKEPYIQVVNVSKEPLTVTFNNQKIDVEGVKILKLSEAELERIGITKQNDGSSIFNKQMNDTTYLRIAMDKESILMESCGEPMKEGYIPRFITDKYGNKKMNFFLNDNNKNNHYKFAQVSASNLNNVFKPFDNTATFENSFLKDSSLINVGSMIGITTQCDFNDSTTFAFDKVFNDSLKNMLKKLKIKVQKTMPMVKVLTPNSKVQTVIISSDANPNENVLNITGAKVFNTAVATRNANGTNNNTDSKVCNTVIATRNANGTNNNTDSKVCNTVIATRNVNDTVTIPEANAYVLNFDSLQTIESFINDTALMNKFKTIDLNTLKEKIALIQFNGVPFAEMDSSLSIMSDSMVKIITALGNDKVFLKSFTPNFTNFDIEEIEENEELETNLEFHELEVEKLEKELQNLEIQLEMNDSVLNNVQHIQLMINNELNIPDVFNFAIFSDKIDSIAGKITIIHDNITSYVRVNKLVPIAVSVCDENNEGDYDYIIWFDPTEELLEKLPEQYCNELSTELKEFKPDDVCTVPQKEVQYFDVWRACAGAVENLTVFPNPANDIVNVNFTLTADRNVTIGLHDLTGRPMATLCTDKSMKKGNHTETYQLQGIEPGLYLVSVQTDQNEQTVQRVIVEK